MTDYRPVDCSLYDRYELAIIRRCPLMLGWRDESGQTHLERVAPLDLKTAAGEEFLVFRTAGGRRQSVRLDRIREVRELPACP